MKNPLELGNQYAKESDWKDFALLKLCLCAMGIVIGTQVTPRYKKIIKERIEGGANEKAVQAFFCNCPFVCISFGFSWLNKARPGSRCVWTFNPSGLLMQDIAYGHIITGFMNQFCVFGIRNKPPEEAKKEIFGCRF